MSTQLKEDHAKQQAKAQLESIVEMVAALTREGAAEAYARDLSRERCVELLTSIEIECHDHETVEELREAVASNIEDTTLEPEDFEFDEDEAQQTIHEDALSVLVRSGWYELGSEDTEPAEFEILLCTGGPAVRIIGDLDDGQPDHPRLQYQDWGTPWTEYFHDRCDALQTYCEQFYFGD